VPYVNGIVDNSDSVQEEPSVEATVMDLRTTMTLTRKMKRKRKRKHLQRRSCGVSS
jgi:hypothetical protein